MLGLRTRGRRLLLGIEEPVWFQISDPRSLYTVSQYAQESAWGTETQICSPEVNKLPAATVGLPFESR